MATRNTKLEEAIRSTGIKKGLIAEALGITSVSLSNKMAGRTQFTEAEKKEVIRLINGVKELSSPQMVQKLSYGDIFQ